MSKFVANGMFNVTAAAEKGAKPQFVYWDECPSSFKFCAGKDGEEVYHIVYNTRNTASSKYSKIPYLCIVSHTKNSTYPSDDVANSVNPKWMNFQTMALFATDLMLARKILADEIDVDSLTVRNVSAVSSDGKTTCTIDGDTGKLKAKKAEFDGVTSNNMTATNMTVDGITATNADVSGKVTATSGKVAGFSISGDGLTNEGFNNDAYVVFRNDTNKCFAGIGGNVLPASTGLRAVARFENHDEGDMWGLGANYAMIASARGARDNIAINMDGGSVCGFAMRNKIIGSSITSITLGRMDYNVIALNANACTLSLPVMQLYDDGHVIRIKRLGDGALKIALSYCYTYSDSGTRYSKPMLLYNQDSVLTGNDTYEIPGIASAMELVWVRDVSRVVSGTTYYGAWIQYKLPRDW